MSEAADPYAGMTPVERKLAIFPQESGEVSVSPARFEGPALVDVSGDKPWASLRGDGWGRADGPWARSS